MCSGHWRVWLLLPGLFEVQGMPQEVRLPVREQVRERVPVW